VWARVVVGIVLLGAGVAKLADRSSSGPPPVVPWLELLLGALLVTGVGGRLPAVAAAALLGAFTVVVVHRLRAEDTAPCGCFGELSKKPVGYRTLLRNVALVLLAVVGALT
jgi:uncharacterized membrane protein YphA (DoxX/SURF4 family)